MFSLVPYQWRHLDNGVLGFMNNFSADLRRREMRREIAMPDLRHGSTLVVASDYSGYHQSARYEALSFVVGDLEACGEWEERRQGVRKLHLRDGRRISYKSLGDRRRQRALLPFLGAADSVRGLLAVFLVDRRIVSLFSGEQCTQAAADPALGPYKCWSPGVFERALRIVHLASFLVAGLSRADQDLMWITDEDDVCANETQHRALVTLFARISSHYLPHEMRHMRLGTTRSDTGARDLEDLVSIADLAAGALVESWTVHQNEGGIPADVLVPLAQGVARKARQILAWLAHDGQPLKRLVYLIDEDSNSRRLRRKLVRLHGEG